RDRRGAFAAPGGSLRGVAGKRSLAGRSLSRGARGVEQRRIVGPGTAASRAFGAAGTYGIGSELEGQYVWRFVARLTLCDTDASQESRFYGCGCPHAGAGRRREHRDLHLDGRGLVEEVAGETAGTTHRTDDGQWEGLQFFFVAGLPTLATAQSILERTGRKFEQQVLLRRRRRRAGAGLRAVCDRRFLFSFGRLSGDRPNDHSGCRSSSR